jgi:hypothetical protein
MAIIATPTHHTDWFQSFTELTQWCMDKVDHNYSGSCETNGYTESLAQACQLGIDGWHDVRDEVTKYLEALKDSIAERLAPTMVSMFATSGGFVDMDRFMTGEPECMVESYLQPVAKHGKVIRIVVDNGASGGFSGEFIRQRGAIICALIDTLAKLGHSVEVWSETTVNIRNGKLHSTVTKLHDAQDLLDIDSLMFGLCHPAMLRRLQFQCRDRAATEHGFSHGGSYGQTTPTVWSPFLEADIVCERLESHAHNMMSDPVKWVMQTVNGLGLGGE